VSKSVESRVEELERRCGAGEGPVRFIVLMDDAGEPVGWRHSGAGEAFEVLTAIYNAERLEPGDLTPEQGAELRSGAGEPVRIPERGGGDGVAVQE